MKVEENHGFVQITGGYKQIHAIEPHMIQSVSITPRFNEIFGHTAVLDLRWGYVATENGCQDCFLFSEEFKNHEDAVAMKDEILRITERLKVVGR
jgi:hypothetical protein